MNQHWKATETTPPVYRRDFPHGRIEVELIEVEPPDGCSRWVVFYQPRNRKDRRSLFSRDTPEQAMRAAVRYMNR